MDTPTNTSSFKQDVAVDIVNRLAAKQGETIIPYDFSEMVDSLCEKAMLTGSITDDVQITRSNLSRYLQNNDEFIVGELEDENVANLLVDNPEQFEFIATLRAAMDIVEESDTLGTAVDNANIHDVATTIDDAFIKNVEKDFMDNQLIREDQARFQTTTLKQDSPTITFSKPKENGGLER